MHMLYFKNCKKKFSKLQPHEPHTGRATEPVETAHIQCPRQYLGKMRKPGGLYTVASGRTASRSPRTGLESGARTSRSSSGDLKG